MKIVTLDFETFFSDDYTLKKLSTEEYIRDARFEAHGAAVKIESEPAQWYTPVELKETLECLGSDVFMLAHHAHFDGLILNHHFDYRPAEWLCTLSMARVCFDAGVKLGLGDLASRFGLAEKNVPYDAFRGRHWYELTPDVQRLVADGSCHDVELTYTIFERMMSGDY